MTTGEVKYCDTADGNVIWTKNYKNKADRIQVIMFSEHLPPQRFPSGYACVFASEEVGYLGGCLCLCLSLYDLALGKLSHAREQPVWV